MYIIKENVKKGGKMFYQFESFEVKPKINKKKVIICILIVLVIIALSVFAAIKFAEYQKQKEIKLELAKIEEEKRIILERIAEEKRKEAEKLKNANPFTEQQMQTIENIYTLEGEKSVFLTFDDGPTQAVTPYILDLLKQENIKATFFVLGNRAKINPELIKREFEEGHYIANHGYTHIYSQIYRNSQTVLEEYNYTESCIQEALNNPNYHSKVFRFPGGSQGGYYRNIKDNAKVYLRQNGIVSLDWNCLSRDAEGARTKEALLQSVIETSKDKQNLVILMHDSADKILTYETLPDIIKYLRDNGYKFKTLYDVL